MRSILGKGGDCGFMQENHQHWQASKMDTEGEQEFEVMQVTTMDFPLPASSLSLTQSQAMSAN